MDQMPKIMELLLTFLSFIVVPILLILMRIAHLRLVKLAEIEKILEKIYVSLSNSNVVVHSNLENWNKYRDKFDELLLDYCGPIPKKFNKYIKYVYSIYNKAIEFEELIKSDNKS